VNHKHQNLNTIAESAKSIVKSVDSPPKHRVLFICKRLNIHYTGGYAAYGLLNSAKFIANALRAIGVESKAVIVEDANGIDREIHQYNPTHVIIHALWVTPIKLAELLTLHPQQRWVIRLHSKAPFIANEGIAFEWLRGYLNLMPSFPNIAISCNNEEFNCELDAVMPGMHPIYLPNIYCPDPITFGPPPPDNSDFNIACFGALRPMKNQLEQALAAFMFADRIGKRLRFHINVDRVEQRGETVLKNMRFLFKDSKHMLVEHPWYSHEEFLSSLRVVDIGMQVSFTESFNIVTADCIKMNVPVVVSDEIDYIPFLFRANPTSVENIIFHLYLAYWFGKVGSWLNLQGLRRTNNNALAVWEDYLKIC